MNSIILKIVIIGESDCGKTALTTRFVEGTFTLDRSYTVGVDFQSETCKY